MKSSSVDILGRMDYDTSHQIQLDEKRRVLKGQSPGTLFILEHDPPVITLGRRAVRDNILFDDDLIQKKGYQVRRVGRGGDVTVHEPGQAVCYFVLPVRSKSAVSFVEGIVDVVRGFLEEEYGLPCGYDRNFPGLWVRGRKICSIGFDLTGGVSLHGIALNVCNTLEGFGMIRPCGMGDVTMTTLSRERGAEVPVEEVFSGLAARYGDF